MTMQPMTAQPHHRSLALDIALGALAGAAAIWATDKLDQAMYDSEPAEARRQTIRARPDGMDPAHVMANRAARAVGTHLGQPHPAGIAVHYAIGAFMAAAYAAMLGRVPGAGAGRGIGFGLTMFAIKDEGLNTLLGTAGKPKDYPWQDHARGFVAHGFFGFAVDTLLRIMGKRA